MALKLKDVAVELSSMTWKEVKNMALHLNHMSWADLEKVECSSSVDDERVNRAIHTWMQRDVSASWAQLVSALRRVEQNATAEKIRARYCPDMPADTQPSPPADTADGAVSRLTNESSAVQAGLVPSTLRIHISNETSHAPPSVPLGREGQHAFTHSVPSLAMAIGPHSSLQSLDGAVTISDSRLKEIEKENFRLKDCFADLRTKTHVYMRQRESSSPTFLEEFRVTVSDLPDHEQDHSEQQQVYHTRLIADFDSVLEAQNVSAIFRIIRPYYDYKNYDLLEFVINKFGNFQLKERMGGYILELEAFEIKTTIKEFVAATTESTELPPFFKSVTIRINKDASVCTLYDIRKFTRSLAKRSSLTPYALMLQHVGINTVVVQLGLPKRALVHLSLAIDKEFQKTQFIVTVTIDGDRLEVYQLAGGCKTGDVSKVNGALHSGIDVNIELPYEDGRTALHLASAAGHVLVVRALLDCGADVRAQDRLGNRTALLLASEEGHVLVVQALLDCGADVRAQDVLQMTPLHWASASSHLPVVQALLDAGADVRAQAYNQMTPLHWASGSGHLPVVQALLDAGADVRAQDNVQWTPLHLASMTGHLPVVQALLDAGADVRAQDRWRKTLLITAAEHGKADVVRELVRRGADINAQDERGLTALMYATLKLRWWGEITLEQRVDMVTVLVGEGADVNAQNEEGLTALMMAAKQGETSLVQILIGADKVDVNIQENTVGWSAIFYAAKDGHLEITRLLLKAGANVLVKDRNSVTAFDIARVHGRDSVCQEMTTMVKKMTTPPQQQHPLQFLRQLVNKSGERAANVFKQLEKWLKQSQRKEQFYQKQRTMNQDELEQIQETITAPTN